jgi:hypothetical protein
LEDEVTKKSAAWEKRIALSGKCMKQ